MGIISSKTAIRNFIPAASTDYWITADNDESIWRYKLHLGDEAYISTDDMPINLNVNPFIVIKPGDFALLLTEEELNLPSNVMAFINIRFDYKQKGLINVSGFHVDPLYVGKLIFSVFNAGSKDIVLRKRDAVFMIFFQTLDDAPATKKYPGYNCIPASMIEQIRGRSVTLASNAHRMDRLESYLKLLAAIVLALVGAIIAK
ncbi:MAG: hypothetical protein IJ521_09765 [Schwartzia sp.]|nr:hypothetical protein [Schwartzia sp. (in: firmicutes)]